MKVSLEFLIKYCVKKFLIYNNVERCFYALMDGGVKLLNWTHLLKNIQLLEIFRSIFDVYTVQTFVGKTSSKRFYYMSC